MAMKRVERYGGSSLSHRAARAALVLAIPLALVLGVRAFSWSASQLKVWTDGDTLKAADINNNFGALAAQIAALAAPLAWTNLGLLNAWDPYGDSYAPPSYAKDALGIVHLRGLVKGSTASQVTIAVLPPGFRPRFHLEADVACGGTSPCTVLIKTTGEMLFEQIYPSSAWLSFDGLTFEAAGP
jgi:hypothetical protein